MSRRSDGRRGRHPLARAVGLAVALLVVVGLVASSVALVAVAVRRPVPDRDGEADVPVLAADVEVLRDAQAVPTCTAAPPRTCSGPKGTCAPGVDAYLADRSPGEPSSAPTDGRYGYRLETWAQGGSHPWAFRREAVEQVVADRLLLRAGG